MPFPSERDFGTPRAFHASERNTLTKLTRLDTKRNKQTGERIVGVRSPSLLDTEGYRGVGMYMYSTPMPSNRVAELAGVEGVMEQQQMGYHDNGGEMQRQSPGYSINLAPPATSSSAPRRAAAPRKLSSDKLHPLPQQSQQTAKSGYQQPQPLPVMTTDAGASSANYRQTINPTQSNRQLMRQISGLGMDDPVFGKASNHSRTSPSGRSDSLKKPGQQLPPSCQMFDDMSLGDLPEDMRDLVSIASDPTANGVDTGLDTQNFHASLVGFPVASGLSSAVNMHTGLSEFLNASRCSMEDDTEQRKIVTKSKPSHGRPVSPNSGSGGVGPNPASKTIPAETPLTKKLSSGAKRSYRKQQHGDHPANLHASLGTLQSLEMEDVFAAAAATEGRQTKQASNNKSGTTTISNHISTGNVALGESRSSKSQAPLHSSRSSGISSQCVSSSTGASEAKQTPVELDDSNNLILEAALAMQKDEGANGSNRDLIMAALSQSFSEFSYEDLVSTNTTKGRGHESISQVNNRSFSNEGNYQPSPLYHPHAQNMDPPPPAEGGVRSIPVQSRTRVMPNISNVFPQQEAVYRRGGSGSRMKRGGKRNPSSSSTDTSGPNSSARR